MAGSTSAATQVSIGVEQDAEERRTGSDKHQTTTVLGDGRVELLVVVFETAENSNSFINSSGPIRIGKAAGMF